MATYTIDTFDSSKAVTGALCVIVTHGYSGTTIDSDSASFIGANTCKYIAPNTYYVILDNVSYAFDGNGVPRNPISIGKDVKIAVGESGSSGGTRQEVTPSNNMEKLLYNTVLALNDSVEATNDFKDSFNAKMNSLINKLGDIGTGSTSITATVEATPVSNE